VAGWGEDGLAKLFLPLLYNRVRPVPSRFSKVGDFGRMDV